MDSCTPPRTSETPGYRLRRGIAFAGPGVPVITRTFITRTLTSNSTFPFPLSVSSNKGKRQGRGVCVLGWGACVVKGAGVCVGEVAQKGG